MNESKTCPRCGAIVTGEGPAGLCAACLMKMGLESRSGSASVVFTEGEKPDRPPPPTIAELAPHFPELELVELVGRGGMGAVYRARQRSLQRDVALKILTVGAGDATFADRFQREARTLASLSHPGIVAVFDFGSRGPWSFLAMEFVEGASLRQMMRARTLGTRESLAIVSQTCEALQYAHDHGVVHRDIKPENVLVTRDGRVKVLDFGLAKLVGASARAENLTEPRQVMGTPHYMAPEQWEKPLTVDHRADIYALGVVFYELLTGELPLGRFEPPSHKVTLDLRLDDVVLRSLEKEPSRRYQHASEVRDDVAGITSTPGGPQAQAVPAGAQTRGKRSKWMAVGAAAGCLLLLVPVVILAMVLVVPRAALDAARTASVEASAAELDALQSRIESQRLAESTSDPVLKDLQMDLGSASYFGIDPERVPVLNRALARVWSRYLEWEEQHVDGTWLGDDRLHVTIRPDGHYDIEAERAEAQAIVRGEVSSTRPMTSKRGQLLSARIAEELRFGSRVEVFDMHSDEEGGFIVTTDGDTSVTTRITTQAGEFNAYRRVWERMLPTRTVRPVR